MSILYDSNHDGGPFLSEEEIREFTAKKSTRKSGRRNSLKCAFPIDLEWVPILSPYAIVVWMAIGTLWRVRRDDRESLKLTRRTYSQFGLEKKAFHRGLKILERHGLVRIERHRGRSHVVTWVDIKTEVAPNADH